MDKKDEDHAREMAQVQRQLLEVLERRPEPTPAQPPGTQIVFNNRGNDLNDLYEPFRKRGPKDFTGHEDPLAPDNWLERIEYFLDIQMHRETTSGTDSIHVHRSSRYIVENGQGRI
ncbi:hypothetical protein AAC387_Pa08g1168 [Persea americana]